MGRFPSVDFWPSSRWMFASVGYNEKWYWTSDCTYNTVVKMNHPETRSITTLTQRVQHKVDASIKSLPISSSSIITVLHEPWRCSWPQCGFLLFSSLVRGNIHAYIDVITPIHPFFSYPIQNWNLLLVMHLLLEFNQSINQSVQWTSLRRIASMRTICNIKQ